VDLTAGLDVIENRNLLLLPEIEPRLLGRPACSLVVISTELSHPLQVHSNIVRFELAYVHKVLTKFHGAASFLRIKYAPIYARIPPPFMQPKVHCSSLCSKSPQLVPGLSQVNPIQVPPSILLRPILILYSNQRPGLPSNFSLYDFRRILVYMNSSPLLCVLYYSPIFST
jgi:hypothetical protein